MLWVSQEDDHHTETDQDQVKDQDQEKWEIVTDVDDLDI